MTAILAQHEDIESMVKQHCYDNIITCIRTPL